MATPPASTVNATATAASTSIMTAIDNSFIAMADQAIADSASRGLFMVRLHLLDGMTLINVVNYYQNLGYVVAAPLPPNVGQQPSNLFGAFWQQYWENPTFFFELNGLYIPKEIYISWTQS
jgi:hypothetical protein